MRNARNRALSLLCAGAILVSAVPVRASAAASAAVEGALIQGVEGRIRIDLGDASIDGTKTVRLSGYMEPIPDAYVEDGLVLRLDGLEGTDAEAGTWTNLAGSRDPVYENNDIVYINRPEVDKVTGEGANYFEGNGLVLDNSKVYLPACVAEAVNGDAYTVEYFVDSEGYSGNERAYSPLLTVDETADSWSIFTRTPGSTMELKQGANARLKVSFESALGAPSAVVFDKASGAATWYLDGTAKGQVNAANPAAAEQVILGGRLADNSGKPGPAYQTEAKYYSVRVYNRALSAGELRANALRDHSRFLGESGLPDLKVKGIALKESGTTEVSLDFTDGVALLPVQSGTLGTLSLKLSVDSTGIPVELETVTPVEAVRDLAAEAMEITVASSATEWDVRAAVEDELKSVLAGSYFLTQGGAIVVSGRESGGFTAKLSLKDDEATVTLQVTVRRSAPTDFDALKPYFIRVMQGTFQFDSAEAVTAHAIAQQVSALLEDETVTPSVRWEEEEGCWMLTLDQGEKSASLPLYINSEVNYDFDDADLLNYCTLRMAGSDYARISGGALEVSGTVGNTYENVVFPVWNFGRDFCIEAEVQLKSAVNNSRWMAVSYGLKPSEDDYQYTFWQMAVRQNATASNGVECANMANGWNVTHTASYGEAISPDKTYKLTILYKDGVIYEYINEEFMIKSERVPAAGADGKIAFTYDRLNAEVKSLRVTSDLPDLPMEKPLAENGYDTDVYEPVTDLVMAPTVVAENSGESAAAVAAGERRPATLVREVAGDLTVEDDGARIALSEYMTRLEKKALAGFRIEDEETAAAFAQYASENSLVDVTVFSTDSKVLKTACAGAPGIRGVLDFTGDMPEKTIDVVFDTNRSGARIALIPASTATRETVSYIQARAVTVWVQAAGDEMDTAILAGADGIVTDDWTAALDAIEAYSSGEQVLTRPTVIVAHRGFHQTAPENSERAAKLAVEAGADAIECDVYLSSDGYVMINHDDTTGRLMNKSLSVSGSTKAELQALTFTVDTAQEGDKMPTLEELFAAADAADPDDDIIHVIEIKSSAPELIDPLVQVIKDCGMEDRVVFISFHDEQIKRIREKMPEISVGELNSCTNSGNDLATNIKGLSDRLDPLNAFYNCNYGAQTEELVQAARHRGIYVHPWTANDQSTFEQEFGDGYHGITSDRVDYATDYLSGLTVESASVTAKTGEANAVAIAADEVRRIGSTPAQQVGFRQLSGVKVRQDEQGRFWAEQAGVAVIVLSATDTLPATGETYTVYSMPVAVEFAQAVTLSGYDTDIYEPVTDLVMAPTVVAENSGESAAAVAAGERRPATLVQAVAGDLTVEDDGTRVSLKDYMARLEKKALAGFRIEDEETAAAFARYMAENGLVDVNVFSTDSEVLKIACAGAPGIRGVLDFTGDMPEKTIDVVFDTNRSGARIALIPASAATRETVSYIQARAVTVWVQTAGEELDQIILSGADGIVTDDWTAALDAIEAYSNGERVLTRPTYIVAHRGFHEAAPENSERAAKLAVEAGADAIECDVYLSSDGYIMVNHDDDTGRLMNENLVVSESTKAELQALTFTVDTAQRGDKMPTLEELFAAADAADPDDDVIHVIELKSTDPAMIEPLVKAVRDCGMEDRVVFISFSDEQIALMRELMPEISEGELNPCTLFGDAGLAENLQSLSERIDPLNAFYNCYYGYGVQTPELVQAARHRGIYVHPWTVDGQSDFEQEFYDGYHGITSNRVDYATDYLSGLTVESASVTAKTGEANAVAIAADEVRRSGSTPAQQVGFRQLSGVKVRQDEQGRFWAEQAGVAVIVLSATDTLPASGETYTVYSDPIAVTFTKDSGSSDKDDDDDDTKPTQPDQPDTTPDTEPAQPDTEPQEPVRFSDVPETYWGYSAIQKLVALQVVNGTDNGAFEPEKSVTRAEFVVMLSRLSGDATGQGSTGFQDVAQDAWYASAVAWAVENGITTGTSETTFAPDAPISRQDMAVMLYRFLNARGVSLNKGGTAGQFLDVNEISSYAAEAVEYMRRTGVINGRPDGSFAPLDSASRAETCSMLAGIADAVRS